MNAITMCTAETMTAERIEDYGVTGIAEPGAIVTIYRVHPDGAAEWSTVVIFTLNLRGCWRSNGMDLWGDADHGEDGKWRLWLDYRPESCGGDWYIAPELGRWMNRLDTADAGYSIDPTTAMREAAEAGACWAENLERGDYSREEFSQIVANANAPCFPSFPDEELFDAAYEAAYEAATAAR
jgi:hypothetical protein